MSGLEKFEEFIGLISEFCPLLSNLLLIPELNLVPMIVHAFGLPEANIDDSIDNLHSHFENCPEFENIIKSVQDKYLESFGYVKK